MASRYELTISTNYVANWTFVEAIRELFQNALDNEIKTPSNKMEFEYDSENETLRISNKTSILEVDSLLLGSSTKTNDKDTIGQHGEGYKIAFMVLLREGKKVKVYNYGKREVWDAKLVKSRRYKGNLVPVIVLEKEVFWKQVPKNDLIIEIAGINTEEYQNIVSSNLNLQDDINYHEIKDMGKILLDTQQKGRVYVCGLYICHKPELAYGYSFSPRVVSLDRDRRLMNTFDIAWETSLMWKKAFADNFMTSEIIAMMEKSTVDVNYMVSRTANVELQVEQAIANKVATSFIEKHGQNSVPVENNEELARVKDTDSKPVIVNSTIKQYIARADNVEITKVPEEKGVKEEFQKLLDDIEHKLDDEEVERFISLLERL